MPTKKNASKKSTAEASASTPFARATRNADNARAELEAAARAFARGTGSFEELAAASKKHTNAVHAVGRICKAVDS